MTGGSPRHLACRAIVIFAGAGDAMPPDVEPRPTSPKGSGWATRSRLASGGVRRRQPQADGIGDVRGASPGHAGRIAGRSLGTLFSNLGALTRPSHLLPDWPHGAGMSAIALMAEERLRMFTAKDSGTSATSGWSRSPYGSRSAHAGGSRPQEPWVVRHVHDHCHRLYDAGLHGGAVPADRHEDYLPESRQAGSSGGGHGHSVCRPGRRQVAWGPSSDAQCSSSGDLRGGASRHPSSMAPPAPARRSR